MFKLIICKNLILGVTSFHPKLKRKKKRKKKKKKLTTLHTDMKVQLKSLRASSMLKLSII